MTLQLIVIIYGSVLKLYEMFRSLTASFMPRQSKSTLITLNSPKSSQDIWLSSLPPAAILIHVPNEILIARYMTLLLNCCPSETCFWACGKVTNSYFLLSSILRCLLIFYHVICSPNLGKSIETQWCIWRSGLNRDHKIIGQNSCF